jgi:hypothetical protein
VACGFIEGKVLRWFDVCREEIAKHPLLHEQAFGESVYRVVDVVGVSEQP